MRSKKALINSIAAFSYEIVSIVCGLILPRLILSHFGSAYNGITSSVSQFLSGITILKSGVGAVAQATLYKPLIDGDILKISSIVKTTERFLRRVALIFMGLMVVFACIYPVWINDEFSWLFSASFIVITSFSTFVENFFGEAYQIVFRADQRQCVINYVKCATLILNTAVASVLILCGCSIHIVKLGSTLAFTINPLIINQYAKRKYKITKKSIEYDNNLIKQRWDAFAKELAMFVHNNTDIIVLTVFTNLVTVSIYTVYHYVTKALNSAISIFTNSFVSAFGNMFAKNQTETIKKNLNVTELMAFSISTILYSVAAVMVVPYALIFTKGVNDANYNQPLFGLLLSLAGMFASFRVPYNTIVSAKGHFKQTKIYAIIEASLNIVISVIAVRKFGLVGVAVGTVIGTAYRTIAASLYVSKNIVERNKFRAVGHMLISCISMVIVVAVGKYIILPIFEMTVVNWFVAAIITTLVSLAVTTAMDFIFYRKDTLLFISKIKILIKSILKKGKKEA